MKKILPIMLFAWSAYCYSQDTIFIKGKGSLIAHILEINKNEIIYKTINQDIQNSLVIKKSEIDYISFKNGSKEFYNVPQENITFGKTTYFLKPITGLNYIFLLKQEEPIKGTYVYQNNDGKYIVYDTSGSEKALDFFRIADIKESQELINHGRFFPFGKGYVSEGKIYSCNQVLVKLTDSNNSEVSSLAKRALKAKKARSLTYLVSIGTGAVALFCAVVPLFLGIMQFPIQDESIYDGLYKTSGVSAIFVGGNLLAALTLTFENKLVADKAIKLNNKTVK